MKKICVIGNPAKHSLSPIIHNYWLNKYGIEGKYEIKEMKNENFAQFFLQIEKEGYSGCNITIPYKEKAYELVGVRKRESEFIGAVNTVWIEKGQLIGSNTDGYGFCENIEKSIQGFDFKGKKAVVLGAGGAARAIISAILAKGAEVTLLNRTIEKAEKLKNDFTDKGIDTQKILIKDWEQWEQILSLANILINTTSLGMSGQEELKLDLKNLPQEAIVTDIVYRPLMTKLLLEAQKRGNKIVDGLGMLLHQARPGFEIWFQEELKARGIKNVEVSKELRSKVEEHL